MDHRVRGDHLPENDHVARYCPGSKLAEDGAPLATAFFLRPNENYLSVEWLEHLREDSKTESIRKVASIFAQKLRVGATARIAVLNVGDVCCRVKNMTTHAIRILHEPGNNDPAHAGIHDTAQDEMIITEIIAETIDGVHDFPL